MTCKLSLLTITPKQSLTLRSDPVYNPTQTVDPPPLHPLNLDALSSPYTSTSHTLNTQFISIIVGRPWLIRFMTLRKSGRAIFALTDQRVMAAQGKYLSSCGFKDSECLMLPHGEQTKSIGHYQQALSFLARNAAKRDLLSLHSEGASLEI